MGEGRSWALFIEKLWEGTLRDRGKLKDFNILNRLVSLPQPMSRMEEVVQCRLDATGTIFIVVFKQISSDSIIVGVRWNYGSQHLVADEIPRQVTQSLRYLRYPY